MSFAADQVARLETLLAENVGVQSVLIDGRQVTYDDLIRQYNYWLSRQAREFGTRPRVAGIDLSTQC